MSSCRAAAGAAEMVWFRVDDDFDFHDKAVAAGNAAVGLWTRAGAYCGRMKTGGFLPEHIAKTLGKPAEIKALVRVDLWHAPGESCEKCPPGRLGHYLFHEWGGRNPDADTMQAARAAESKAGALGNHKRWHAARKVIVPECPYCVTEEEQPPLPPAQIQNGEDPWAY